MTTDSVHLRIMYDTDPDRTSYMIFKSRKYTNFTGEHGNHSICEEMSTMSSMGELDRLTIHNLQSAETHVPKQLLGGGFQVRRKKCPFRNPGDWSWGRIRADLNLGLGSFLPWAVSIIGARSQVWNPSASFFSESFTSICWIWDLIYAIVPLIYTVLSIQALAHLGKY